MSKRKVCKRCKIFYDEAQCPICKDNQTAGIWKGRIAVIDSEKSAIARKVGIKMKGEYAIKIR